jgi:hypothetical protein
MLYYNWPSCQTPSLFEDGEHLRMIHPVENMGDGSGGRGIFLFLFVDFLK